MSDQRDLFDQEERPVLPDPEYRARSSDPDTSHEWAAKKNRESRAKWLAIMAALRARGPLTYAEVSEITGIAGTSTSTDLAQMDKIGLVAKVRDGRGRKVTRNSCMLRELTSLGAEALERFG